MAKGTGQIRGLGVYKGFARSFFVQAGWNAERMQNIGFAYSLIPLIDGLKREGDGKDNLSRHLEFFNTHPYMTGALAAAVGKMERDGEKEEAIRAFKQSMMGPFGALGDSLFWFSLKPAALLVGVVCALAGEFLLAVLVPLILYNAFHLWMRVWSYQGGIREGSKLVSRISTFRFSKVNAALGITAATALSVLVVCELAPEKGLSGVDGGAALSCALTAVVVFLVAVAVKRGLKPVTLFYLVAGFGMAAALTVP